MNQVEVNTEKLKSLSIEAIKSLHDEVKHRYYSFGLGMEEKETLQMWVILQGELTERINSIFII